MRYRKWQQQLQCDMNASGHAECECAASVFPASCMFYTLCKGRFTRCVWVWWVDQLKKFNQEFNFKFRFFFFTMAEARSLPRTVGCLATMHDALPLHYTITPHLSPLPCADWFGRGPPRAHSLRARSRRQQHCQLSWTWPLCESLYDEGTWRGTCVGVLCRAQPGRAFTLCARLTLSWRPCAIPLEAMCMLRGCGWDTGARSWMRKCWE